MYLDKEEQEKIITYLIENKSHIQDLLKELTEEKDKIVVINDPVFKEDIEVEFIQIARMIIAQDIGKNTGLSPEGILFVLEYLGIQKLKEYLQ